MIIHICAATFFDFSLLSQSCFCTFFHGGGMKKREKKRLTFQ